MCHRQSGAVRRGAVRTTSKQLHFSSPLQYVYSQAGAHHVTVADGFDYISPPEACSLSDVTVEGSWVL